MLHSCMETRACPGSTDASATEVDYEVDALPVLLEPHTDFVSAANNAAADIARGSFDGTTCETDTKQAEHFGID